MATSTAYAGSSPTAKEDSLEISQSREDSLEISLSGTRLDGTTLGIQSYQLCKLCSIMKSDKGWLTKIIYHVSSQAFTIEVKNNLLLIVFIPMASSAFNVWEGGGREM